MNREQLAKKIKDLAHLTGDFLLRSGTRSNTYFDKYRFESDPQTLQAIADHLAPLIPPGTEVLAGLEMGGIPLATALSLKTGIPVVFVRKEAKAYGTCRIAEGADFSGRHVCVIEDVITTGGQVLLSTADLRAQGAVVTDVLCVILRGDFEKLGKIGVTGHALFTMDELLRY